MLGELAMGKGISPVLPLASGWVDDAEEFVVGHGFGVEVVEVGLALLVLVGAVKRFPDLRLAGAGEAYDEHRVPDKQQLFQLDHLQHEAILRLQIQVQGSLFHLLLKFGVALSGHVEGREQIT